MEKSLVQAASVRTLATQAYEPDVLMSVQEWFIDDSLLVCRSGDTPSLFYRLRLSDFACKDSFGVKGTGPEEYVLPHLSVKSPQEYMIIDNGKEQCMVLDKVDGSVKTSFAFPGGGNLVNLLQTYEYPLVSYVDYKPNALTWVLQDVEKQEVRDTLAFVDASRKGEAVRYELRWDFEGGNLAVAFFNFDQFLLMPVRDDGRLGRGKMFRAGSGQDGKVYYTDIACADGCLLFLLSQRKVNVETGEGCSEVEVYDYQGNPKACYTLDILAEKMLYDAAAHRLVFTSPMDDRIYVGSLQEGDGLVGEGGQGIDTGIDKKQ